MRAKMRYSYEWAASVINRFNAQYGRATEIVCRAYRLTKHHLALLLACGDPLWPFLRSRIHETDKRLKYASSKYLTDDVINHVESIWSEKYPDQKRLLDRLTTVAKLIKLEEQAIRQGNPSEAKRKEDSFLLDPAERR